MRARYYDPAVHQFLTRDPQVEVTNESYNYAGNNPTLNTDPSGESYATDFANGMIQGASNGLLKPGSAAGSCSWAYFLGLQAGGALNPAQKAKKLRELIAEAKIALKGRGALSSTKVVIGKLADLEHQDALSAGEKTLLDQLPDRGSEDANWEQNRRILLLEMSSGAPIRDASVDPRSGALINETGFLARERNLLRSERRVYDPGTHLWSPGAQ